VREKLVEAVVASEKLAQKAQTEDGVVDVVLELPCRDDSRQE
jgi:hypothetical protein